jgi:hypothetical protein
MGRQIGVPAETVTHRLLTENQKASQIAATSYLHDVSVRLRMLAVDHVELISNIWKMRDKFGAKEAKKLFYWNNQDYVTLSPEKCYSTLLKHPTNGVLAFVSNLRPEAQTVTVNLNLEKPGLSDKKLEVFNTLTDELVAMTPDGNLSIDLGSEEWIFIWLRPQGAVVKGN